VLANAGFPLVRCRQSKNPPSPAARELWRYFQEWSYACASVQSHTISAAARVRVECPRGLSPRIADAETAGRAGAHTTRVEPSMTNTHRTRIDNLRLPSRLLFVPS
jgi:hypothetical protein